jgi:hypothetical protein
MKDSGLAAHPLGKREPAGQQKASRSEKEEPGRAPAGHNKAVTQ